MKRRKTIIMLIIISMTMISIMSIICPGISPPLLAAITDGAAVNTLQNVSMPDDLFASISALSAGILIITAYIKKLLGTQDGHTIIISGVIGLILSALGYIFNLGIFNLVEWYYIIIYGLISTLIANGLSTWEIVRQILTFFKLRIPEGG
jgi:hypothetical protein